VLKMCFVFSTTFINRNSTYFLGDMMDLAEWAVVAVAFVAVAGVFMSAHGGLVGNVIYLPPSQGISNAICTESAVCSSQWQCCAGGKCECASDDDAMFYKVMTDDQTHANCYTDARGLLQCEGTQTAREGMGPPLTAIAEPVIPAQGRPSEVVSEYVSSGVPTEGIFLA